MLAGVGAGGGHGGHAAALLVGEAADPQTLGTLEEGVEGVLGHVDLAVVHELEQGVQVVVADITEHDDRVLTRVALNSIKKN